MIPLGDADRRPVGFPLITGAIIIVCTVVFVLEVAQGQSLEEMWALVPANVAAGRDWITILTSMFMHASVLHIAGNMLFFWVFGPEIEDVMGPFAFLLFYLVGGTAAVVTQVAIDPSSTIPVVGASGAIAAVMGAFLVTYPRDRIRTVLILGWFIRITLVPAVLLVGLWFIIQLIGGVGTVLQAQSGGVAYMAHVGGFIFGAIFGRVFETRERRARQGLP